MTQDITKQKRISLKDKLILGTFWDVLGTGGRLLLAIGGSVVFVRYLGDERYGIATYLADISLIVIVIASLGLGTLQAKIFPQLRVGNRLGEYRYLLLHNTLIRIGMLCIIFVSIYCLQQFGILRDEIQSTYFGFFYLFSFFQIILSILRGSLLVEYQQKLVNIVDVGALILRILLVIPVIYFDSGLTGFLLTEVVAEIIQIVILSIGFYFAIWKKIKLVPMEKYSGKIFPISLMLFIIDFSSKVFSKEFDILLLSFLLTSNKFSEITIYSLCYILVVRAFSFLGLGTANTATLLMTSSSELIAQRNIDLVSKMLEKQFKMLILFVLPLVGGGVVLGENILIMLYGTTFSGKAYLIASLFLAHGIYSMIYITKPILYSMGKEKKMLSGRLSWMSVKIVLAIMLIPRFGNPGMVAVAVLTLIGLSLTELILANFVIKLTFPWKCLIKTLVAVLGMIGVEVVAGHFIAHVSLATTILNIIIGAVSYISFLFLIKPITKEDYSMIIHAQIIKKLKLNLLIPLFVEK